MKCGNVLHKVNGGKFMSLNFNKNIGNKIKCPAHSKHKCQYHIVFAQMYERRWRYDVDRVW